MGRVSHVSQLARHVRSLGVREGASILGEQLWYTKRFFGLRADLTSMPEVREAKVPVRMKAVDAPAFAGFDDEATRVSGPDLSQVVLRAAMCHDSIPELYVAADDDGNHIYAQWLTRACDQEAVHYRSPGRYPTLGDDEVLLEGAYTFVRFRGLGVMRDGMGQLLRIAAAEGARSALTYVEAHNVPSLRGCAGVGFTPVHVRASVRRLGARQGETRPPTPGEWELWKRATAPSG